jgi:hypothetical protein
MRWLRLSIVFERILSNYKGGRRRWALRMGGEAFGLFEVNFRFWISDLKVREDDGIFPIVEKVASNADSGLVPIS